MTKNKVVVTALYISCSKLNMQHQVYQSHISNTEQECFDMLMEVNNLVSVDEVSPTN